MIKNLTPEQITDLFEELSTRVDKLEDQVEVLNRVNYSGLQEIRNYERRILLTRKINETKSQYGCLGNMINQLEELGGELYVGEPTRL